MSDFKYIFIGGRGRIFALDKMTGNTLWEVQLKDGFLKVGNDLVSLLETRDRLYAFSYGTLYRIKKDTGEIEWKTYIPYLKHHAGLLAVDGYSNSVELGVACDGDSNDGGLDGGD